MLIAKFGLIFLIGLICGLVANYSDVKKYKANLQSLRELYIKLQLKANKRLLTDLGRPEVHDITALELERQLQSEFDQKYLS